MDQTSHEALARRHLDKALSDGKLTVLQRPPKGWIRAIRDALGMTTRQLAARMGKTHSVIVRLEAGEMADTISLGSLRAAAEALGCTLVYALVPDRPLNDIVHEKAAALAEAQLARLNHTMRLEDQALRNEDLAQERDRLTAAILQRGGSRLWDEL